MPLTLEHKPKHKHDCGKCQYLGTYNEHDIYYCVQPIGLPTVIARWGEDDQYLSGAQIARTVNLHDPGFREHFIALRVAYLLAKDLGWEI